MILEVQPLAVDLMLLRSLQSAELRLAPGRVLAARVVRAEPHGHGAISIAGALIEAELPAHVRAGQELRLVVRHLSAERVVLALAEDAPAAPAPGSVPLPGGGVVRLEEQAGGRTGSPPGTYVLALRYDAPALGAVDLRFVLDPRSLSLTVAVAGGESHALAQAAAGELRDALAAGLGRTVSVTVTPRRDPLEVYA